MSSLHDANAMVMKIFTQPTTDLSIFLNYKSLLFPLYILIIADIIDEFFPRLNPYRCHFITVRWLAYLLTLVLLLLFGVFDAGQFIYVNF